VSAVLHAALKVVEVWVTASFVFGAVLIACNGGLGDES
jgi:hypothetical protein